MEQYERCLSVGPRHLFAAMPRLLTLFVEAGTRLVHYDDDGLYIPTSEEFLTLCMRS